MRLKTFGRGDMPNVMLGRRGTLGCRGDWQTCLFRRRQLSEAWEMPPVQKPAPGLNQCTRPILLALMS